MRRPLFALASAYAAGLLAGHFLPAPLPLLFAASFLTLLAAFFLAPARPFLLWPLLFLAGWTNLASRTAILSPLDLRLSQSNRVEIVTLRGRLPLSPSQRIYLRDALPASRSLAHLDSRQILRPHAQPQPAFGRVLVLTPGALPPAFCAGQQVEITGVLSPPPRPKAQGLFDYRSYLRHQRIYYQLKTTTNDWTLLSPPRSPPWNDRSLAWAQATLARGLPDQDQPLRLLWSMCLGLKNEIERQDYDPFIQSGTMHIFAISGLHIALITGILVMILRTLRIPRAWCGGIVLPLIWLYTAATGWQPSAIRSTIMMSVIIFGWALERPSDLLNSLGAAALIILLWDPQQLFGASFQLSFMVVLSIALLLPPIQSVRDRLLQHDPLLPPELVPRWRRWAFTPLRWITNAVSISLAAWVGALPITAFYFHIFSPITLLANLLVVPVSSLALASVLGSLACGLAAPWLSECFNFGAWFWMSCIVKFSGWVVALPKAYVYVRGPSAPEFIVYYAMVIGLFSGFLLRPRIRRWAVAGTILVCCAWLWRWQANRAVAIVNVLPLDGGMSVLARAPRWSQDLLIDTGPVDSAGFELKPFLAAKGINSLPALLLSHGDTRHIGGAGALTTFFPAKQICVSRVPQRSSNYRALLKAFSGRPNLLRNLSRGDHVGAWKVLHPAAEDRFSRADDAALVLFGEFNGTRLLLLSDLGRAGQEVLIEREPALRADIVVTGLPSAGEPLCEGLLDRIRPGVIIVADSELPSYERAKSALLERFCRRKVPVISTRAAGAVTIILQKGAWRIRSMDGTQLRGGPPG